MTHKYFTVLSIAYYLYNYFGRGDYYAFAQISMILLWYLLFDLMYKKDELFLNSVWILTNCFSIGIFTIFIIFPIEYGIMLDLPSIILFGALLFLSMFNMTIFFRY